MTRAGQIDLFTRRVRKLPPPKEFAIHCMVADDLERWCKPTWRYTHIPNGELRAPATAGRLKRMGVMPGWPDFFLLGPDGPHCLELKRQGEDLSPSQEAFRDFCKAVGTPYEVADSYKKAVDILTGWGVLKVTIKA
jgi:hypothetical protein